MIHNVIIIGSGPAGYTAALYAARAQLAPVLFTGLQPGGQLMITTDVENYPGFPEGIIGPEMMMKFREQAERFGTEIRDEHILRADLSSRPFRLWTDREEFQCSTLIIATGAEAKWLGLESEVTYGGFGVSACATCDGFFFKGKEVVVVGGGDTAMEEANFLTRMCSKVYLIHRRDKLRASKIMQDRVLANPKIEPIWNTEVTEILGVTEPVKKVTGVRLKSTIKDHEWEMPIGGVFIAIGHKPNSELFENYLERDELGYLRTEPYSSRSQIPGVFIAGDVADRVYRQAVTAAGSGCMAAIDAERFLESEGH